MSAQSGRQEQALARAFVQLADTLVTDFDLIDLFNGLCADCVQIVGVDAAGLMLTDQRGALQVVAASSETAHLLELFQLQAGQGPCVECYRTSAPVGADDLSTDRRWPRFSRRAREHGFTAAHALPMRLREETIGGLNLFHHQPRAMTEHELSICQALADVATIAILSERRLRDRATLTEQLQHALNSRIVIEQAKGLLAGRGHIGLDEAFTALRSHARATSTRLTDLARSVVDGSYDTSHLLPHSQHGTP